METGLRIRFARDPEGRTFLSGQRAAYPFHLCRPFYLDGDPAGMATVYVQSCAGGIFEHDRLSVRLSSGAATAVHVTSQASTIVHGMTGGMACQAAEIEAGADALVEYLPDPLILFPRSRFDNRLTIRVHENATVIAGDAFLAHDPAGRGGVFDWFSSTLSVTDGAGRPLVFDRFSIEGSRHAGLATGVAGGFRAQGSLIVLHRAGAAESMLDRVRTALASAPDTYGGASLLPGGVGLWVRFQTMDGAALRAAASAAWVAVRQVLAGRAAPLRRK